MKAIFVGGTWSRRQKGKPAAAWLREGSFFEEMCRKQGIQRKGHMQVWSTHEDGLIAEDVADDLARRPKDHAWVMGGLQLADLLMDNPDVDMVISHSHGAQVVAQAALNVADRKGVGGLMGLRWLAVDPPVRREVDLHMGYLKMGAYGAGVVQTISSPWNWRSWPRWAGARRWPWDEALLPRVKKWFRQPGGHSAVLNDPHAWNWWMPVLRAAKGER